MPIEHKLRQQLVRSLKLNRRILIERNHLMSQIDDLNAALADQATASTAETTAVGALQKSAGNIPAGTDLTAAIAAAKANTASTVANTAAINAVVSALPQNPPAA